MTPDIIALIQLTVNGRSVELPDGATLLDAAHAAGVHVPTLCYHPRLPSHAVCRMCLVDVGGRAQPACVTRARPGDVVQTDTAALAAFRHMDLAWLLARHPNDCMRCEVDGSCALQKLVADHPPEGSWEVVPRGSDDHPEHRLIDHTSPRRCEAVRATASITPPDAPKICAAPVLSPSGLSKTPSSDSAPKAMPRARIIRASSRVVST